MVPTTPISLYKSAVSSEKWWIISISHPISQTPVKESEFLVSTTKKGRCHFSTQPPPVGWKFYLGPLRILGSWLASIQPLVRQRSHAGRDKLRRPEATVFRHQIPSSWITDAMWREVAAMSVFCFRAMAQRFCPEERQVIKDNAVKFFPKELTLFAIECGEIKA